LNLEQHVARTHGWLTHKLPKRYETQKDLGVDGEVILTSELKSAHSL